MGSNNWSRSAIKLSLGLVAAAQVPLPQSQAQTDAKTSSQIEVASIKPSKPGAVVQDARISCPPGRFDALNITLSEIVDYLNGFTGRVEGGPKWAQSERYDIVAKTGGVLAPAECRQAVLALLQDRFKLAIHREPRDQAGFALTIGKKAPNLMKSKDEEATRVTSDAHKAVFQAVYMGSFVSYIRQMLHVPIVDRTALSGRFDFSLNMDAAAEELFADRVRVAGRTNRIPINSGKAQLGHDDATPSLTTVVQAALKEFLALRGFGNVPRKLHITPSRKGSGSPDISIARHRYLAGK